jgi:hypothetical protein
MDFLFGKLLADKPLNLTVPKALDHQWDLFRLGIIATVEHMTCVLGKYALDTTDWNRVNEFCNNPRIAGKPFVQVSTAELEQLAIKLRAIQRKGGLTDK